MHKRSTTLLAALFVLIAIVACSNNNDELQAEIDDLKAQVVQAKASASDAGAQTEIDSLTAQLNQAKDDLAAAVTSASEAAEDATQPGGWGSRLKLVRDRGKLICVGVNDHPGFNYIDEDGEWMGYGIEMCKAYATAIFGDHEDRWEMQVISWADRPTTMQAGKIDVMVLANTQNARREATWGNFTTIHHYAGMGIMSRLDSGIVADDWQSLDAKTLCVSAGTNYVPAAEDLKGQYGIDFDMVQLDDPMPAYDQGRCDFIIAGKADLGRDQADFTNPDAHVVWDSLMGKDPWGMLVGHGDDQWYDLIRFVEWVMINAEELGVTSENVDEMAATSENARIRRMLGVEGEYGQEILGLDLDFGHNVIKKIGNFHELVERFYSKDESKRIGGFFRPRANDALWNQGGLLFAPGLE